MEMAGQAFSETVEKYMATLKKYVPVVARVHGKAHPEFHDVHKLFNSIEEKLASDDLKLDDELAGLREVTDDFTVPDDVCETYEAVYRMLSELDQAYRS